MRNVEMGKGLFWVGLVMVFLGAAAVIMPLASSLVLEVLIGWLLTMSGIVAVVGAMQFRGTGQFLWQLLVGLITLAVGLLMLLYPLQGLVALTVLVAAIFVLTGLAQASFSFWLRPAPGWGWGMTSALISLGLGVYIFAVLSEASTVVLGLLVGIDFLSTGLALVMISRSPFRM
ncbi:acid-resistance membrane protein [Phaeobacter sp. CECT 5382]|uniref:HdeD family acid-resistance protein n=1 Tax=Phaeobacter sp. CECT 5382 TaxID=1712645 RepID=UPI0006D9B487|nr:DUF308 domain-containing protein [Phaeobacter sp. CECT 5382]CUH89239.1 acid-resistance membrane protein [Phaeobacter sp. CECT 5382]